MLRSSSAAGRQRRKGLTSCEFPLCSRDFGRRGSAESWRLCLGAGWPWILQARILSAHRIGDRFLETARALPLAARADIPVAPDLVDPPIDLQTMIVGVTKLHRDLTAGSAPSGEIDRDTAAAQKIVRAQNFVQGRDLKGEVIELN